MLGMSDGPDYEMLCIMAVMLFQSGTRSVITAVNDAEAIWKECKLRDENKRADEASGVPWKGSRRTERQGGGTQGGR